MKRLVIAIITAVLAQFVALTLVVLTAGWANDAESMRAHFIAGFALIGLCVGVASAWFAPSVVSAVVVTGTILALVHVPDIPDNMVEGAAQLIASLLSAAVSMTFIVKYHRGEGTHLHE